MTIRQLLAVCALAAPLAATPQDTPPAAAHSEHEQHAAPSAEADADDSSMGAMQGNMRMMREQMQRMHATQDPGERQRLMREHMQSMQQHMRMMGSMRGGEPAGSASRCASGDTPCTMEEMRAENGMMRERMRMMEGRLDSMQQLMREMMDHLEEVQSGAATPQ